MNLDKILLYCDNLTLEAMEFALNLAAKLSAKIFTIYVIDPKFIAQKVKLENKDKEKIKDEIEDFAWKVLYEIEDRAALLDVKTSLLLLEGKPSRILREIAEGYEISLLIIPRFSRLNLERFLAQNKERAVIIF